MLQVRAKIQQGFPNLAATFQVTSDTTPKYNCIAWAAGDTSRWWWPSTAYYWPSEAPRIETLDAFVKAFATLGYTPCADGSLEVDSEKVAIYCDMGTPTHMARQMRSGAWTSKLGRSWDIGHIAPAEVGGPLYGSVTLYLSRRRA
jgi:hypothetical protein